MTGSPPFELTFPTASESLSVSIESLFSKFDPFFHDFSYQRMFGIEILGLEWMRLDAVVNSYGYFHEHATLFEQIFREVGTDDCDIDVAPFPGCSGRMGAIHVDMVNALFLFQGSDEIPYGILSSASDISIRFTTYLFIAEEWIHFGTPFSSDPLRHLRMMPKSR
jgi:hypothetical protein